ncbi:MAG: helix-turn-helix transcriptional regulator [Oleiphilaceae bacterium]|nr:helix-turn-helix transcriptional regulator [Oleiphilaceae bacterium]
MATDDEKSRALELLLKDSLHALESLENFQQLEDDSESAPPSEPDSDTSETEQPDSVGRRKKRRDRPLKADDKPGNDDGITPTVPASAEDEQSLFNRLSGYTSTAYRLARRTTGTSFKVGRALIGSQDQLRMMLAAGESLRDLREVAGMTVSDLSDALNIRDKSLLEAVEDGTATLSFELILRLAAVLARNDPLPFILKYTRTYSPDTWRVLSDWGVGRLPLQFEREREFINIYRRHDEARHLSDEGFKRVLEFTRQSFEMSLHFAAEQEKLLNQALDDLEAEQKAAEEEGRKPKTPRRRKRPRPPGEERDASNGKARQKTSGKPRKTSRRSLRDKKK